MRRILTLSFVLCLAAAIVGPMLYVGHTQTTLPAPTVDRIGGIPPDYQSSYQLLYTFDNFQNRQIRVVYGNATAASVTPGNVFNFPYGSIILFESWSVQEDATGEPILDANGRFIKNALTTIFMMRKERGFGVDYQQIRNGEWEYVAYRPDGSYATPPSGTGSCALCHLTGGGLALSSISENVGARWDYVFRLDLYFNGGSGAVPQGVMNQYVFVPQTIHAQPGQVITVYNADQLLHHIVADDSSFDTGVMAPGASFAVTAGGPDSVISYHCTIHSRMRGSIVVDPRPGRRHPRWRKQL